jgi:hypothetical protein
MIDRDFEMFRFLMHGKIMIYENLISPVQAGDQKAQPGIVLHVKVRQIAVGQAHRLVAALL